MKKHIIVLLVSLLLVNYTDAKNPIKYAKNCVKSAENIFIACGWSFASYLGFHYSYHLFTENLKYPYKYNLLTNFAVPMVYALLGFWCIEKSVDSLSNALIEITQSDEEPSIPSHSIPTPAATPYPYEQGNEAFPAPY